MGFGGGVEKGVQEEGDGGLPEDNAYEINKLAEDDSGT